MIEPLHCKVMQIKQLDGTMVYEGYVICVHNGKTMWNEFTLITRLTELDAMQDAINLKNDLMQLVEGRAA